MKLYMIRHGETDWNKERKLQGQIDIPLNAFGRYLAEETRPALEHVDFDLAITSPLGRAKETAQIVLGDRQIPLIEDIRIREMGFGEFEGLHCKGEKYDIPDPDFHYFYDDPEKYLPPKGGESFQQVSCRLREFLDDLFSNKDWEDKTILISTHGAALCGILQLIKQKPISEFWGKGVHKNCALTMAERTGERIQICWENVTYYKAEVENW